MFLWRNLDPGTVAAVVGYLRRRAARGRSLQADRAPAGGRHRTLVSVTGPDEIAPVQARAGSNEACRAGAKPSLPLASSGGARGSGGS